MADDAAAYTGHPRKSRRNKTQERQRNRQLQSDQYHYVEEEHRNGGKSRTTTIALEDPNDGAGSLSYSASSCDSSSGHTLDIENLDIVDPTVKALLRENEVKGGGHIVHEKIVSDRPSHSTIYSGQPSDSSVPDGDGSSTNHSRSGEPRERRMNDTGRLSPLKHISQKLMNDSPRDIRKLRAHSPSTRSDTSVNSSGNSTPTSPPPRSKASLENRRRSNETSIQKELWYSKSWMCGFTDALNFSSH